MVRRFRRLAAVVVSGIAAPLLALTLAEPAMAAPKTPPAGVDITGHGLGEPLRLRAESHPEHVVAVIEQVNHRGLVRQSGGPKKADLGPKYTVVVFAGDVPKQTYDLYPKAVGGPRVYRPAKQPDNKVTASWYLGRVSMSETLRTAGVPLERTYEAVTGGAGGGERIIPEEALNPAEDLNEAFGELRRLLLLNVAVMLVITVGLAGIALLIRRRTR
ncbi:hypothetical protein SAMN05443287_10965 [Micromonospora phaseoli]|uniref:Uncharacterized protein n=1 Tax=Micromonospora phaseoli TaxID=1144548 RepID=A0A1H7CBP8_9ACTN|nr:hypothetical protein [Micromonospora phaseoli]PZV97923.1 hypothetical protein CLV64_105189 [Micromonospora phaseoli]GIJ78590.1 hypothetical protein Xph01_30220 [Micromonospora phaseoli]SEJ87273.1 hypothetical protein SAMN05443287_10965 [Micromonospora phaseoli]